MKLQELHGDILYYTCIICMLLAESLEIGSLDLNSTDFQMKAKTSKTSFIPKSHNGLFMVTRIFEKMYLQPMYNYIYYCAIMCNVLL